MIGVAGWAVLFGLLLAWEGLSITIKAPGWPSSSDMLRAATRPVVGRWVLFAMWLWLGWHLFMRGWTFFLAGPGAHTPPPRSSRSTAQLFTEVVLPLVACYVGSLALVAAGRRGRARRAEWTAYRETLTACRRVRHVVVTVTCGYVVFVAVMGVYALVSGQFTDLFSAAVREGAFLAFAVATPLFLLATVAEAHGRSHHGKGRP